MIFTTPSFVFVFLPVILVAYFVIPAHLINAKNALLLAFSMIFYAWGEPVFVFVLMASIAANYALALMIANARAKGESGKRYMVTAVAANIGMLVAFKYLAWLVALISGGALELDIRLPLGISFFTFQALSYVIDVYRGNVEAQRSLYKFALYASFFPNLIAGPITRYGDIAPQIERREVTMDGFVEGMRRFMWGFGQKALIADMLSYVVENVFDVGAGNATAGAAWLAIVCYLFQIYNDFAGYSSMAIGMAKMFGFDLPENFDNPYVPYSMRDFWRRWHISLSTWFRDYLYIPLGGSRRGKLRTCINTMIVFFVMGLWHGANVNFLIFGLINGLFVTLERMGVIKRKKPPEQPATQEKQKWTFKLVRRMIVEIFILPVTLPINIVEKFYPLLVWMFSLIFFRASDFNVAVNFLKSLVGLGAVSAAFPAEIIWNTMDLSGGMLIWRTVYFFKRFPKNVDLSDPEERQEAIPVWLGRFVFFIIALFAMAASTNTPFIYFRF